MWIKSFILASCLITALLAADEHRPKRKDDRGKRNLEYSISHHYSGPHSYRPERRISTGSLLYHNPPFFPGPRSYSSYRTGRPYSLPPPPYAVQMEPLIQYSQKDPLYDTNIFSLHTDDLNDLSTDTNHINEHIYGPPKPQIIERPVYIKEPEPIIEIIIKESNVTLPPIPTTPPPKKKKEEVQVFYVKYKKNPNGHGKDSVIYDKPVPAISPPIHDEEEKLEPEPHYHARESVTLPPPPSTTLRTIINPDSETYHSPSGIKVTFGKESFDYSKRQVNKFDKNGPQQIHFPQGRQLSPPSNFHKRAPGPSYNLQFNPNSYRPEPRQPQPYRPFNAPSNLQFKPSVPSNIRDTSGPGPQFTQSKPPFQSSPYSKLPSPQFSRPPPPFPSNGSPYPQFPTGALNPPPPTFQSPRPAVPYKPFEHLKPNTTPSPTFEPHQENFGAIQQPSFIKPSSFQPPQHLINQQPQFSQPLPTPQQQFSQPLPSPQQQHQFKPESHFPTQQQLPLAQQSHRFSSQAQVRPIQVPQPTQIVQPQQNFIQQQQQLQQQQLQQQQLQQQQLQQQQQQQQIHQHQQQHQQQQHQQQQQQFAPNSQNEHLLNLQHAQNILPPGGELIQSLPKYEQHFSIIEPGNNQSPQSLALQQSQASTQNGQNNQNLAQQHNQNSFESQKYNQKIQEDLLHLQSRGNLNSQQQQQQQQQQTSNVQQQYYQQFNNQNQQNIYTTPKSAPVYKTSSSTPRVIYQSTTQPTTTTTEETVTIPTTTKDPKILEAQLPDEVPEDLRAQLLSSGILNNADISILDYDKVGDIPLSALPPDQLANFYNAGGGAQIGSESKQIHAVLKVDGTKVENPPLDLDSAGSEITETKAKTGVEMKLVKYNPETDQGQKIQEAYIKDDATQVDPVVLNDDTYSRYLPLKVNGTQFPIPDVPELRGKQISSVVVLAPIAYDFSSQRKTRNVNASDELDLVQGEALKALLANPSLNNYKSFLDSQNRTKSEKQAVILLVIGDGKTKGENKEIYMYDIGTQSVSKLSGELSSAFVEAAEANAEKDAEDSKSAASNRIERRIHFEEETDRTSTIDQTDRKS